MSEYLKAKYPEVASFVERMYYELEANSDKGDQQGWRAMSLRQAQGEIAWHVGKLTIATRDEDEELMRELLADIANGAMMMTDILDQRSKV